MPAKEMDRRAIACFDEALEDAGLATDPRLRRALHDYFAWATTVSMTRYHQSADDVPDGLRVPHWAWGGAGRAVRGRLTRIINGPMADGPPLRWLASQGVPSGAMSRTVSDYVVCDISADRGGADAPLRDVQTANTD